MIKRGSDLIAEALIDADVLSPSERPDTSNDTFRIALDTANEWLDLMATEEFFIPSETIHTFALRSGKDTYTVGDEPGSDWEVAYPESIDRWSIVLNNGTPSEREWPRGQPLTAREWQGIIWKGRSFNYPRYLYLPQEIDEETGSRTARIWPAPIGSDVAVRIYLFSAPWRSIRPAVRYQFPPGYPAMIRAALTVEFVTAFQRPFDPKFVERAERTRMKLENQNRQQRLRARPRMTDTYNGIGRRSGSSSGWSDCDLGQLITPTE